MTEAPLKKLVEHSATGGKKIRGTMCYKSVGIIPQNEADSGIRGGKKPGFASRAELLRVLKKRTGETLQSLSRGRYTYKILHLYPYVKKDGKWVIDSKKRYFLYSHRATTARRG